MDTQHVECDSMALFLPAFQSSERFMQTVSNLEISIASFIWDHLFERFYILGLCRLKTSCSETCNRNCTETCLYGKSTVLICDCVYRLQFKGRGEEATRENTLWTASPSWAITSFWFHSIALTPLKA